MAPELSVWGFPAHTCAICDFSGPCAHGCKNQNRNSDLNNGISIYRNYFEMKLVDGGQRKLLGYFSSCWELFGVEVLRMMC